MAWLDGWAKRIKLTVDNANIDNNLVHFPIPIFLGTSVGKSNRDLSEVFDDLGANDKKIAVTKSDGVTQIYVEVEQWNYTNEEAVLWASKSDLTLNKDSETILYLYYDNSQPNNTTYVFNPGSGTLVWQNDFEAVYHMNDPNVGEVEQWNDGFEDNNLDEYTAGDNWSTASDQKYTGTYSMKGIASDSTGRSIYREMASGTSNYFMVDFYWRGSSNSNLKNYYIVHRPNYALVGYNGDFKYWNGSNYIDLPTSTSFSANTWYHIQVYGDATTNSLMYWIDGAYKGTVGDISFGPQNGVHFITYQSGGHSMWVDNLKFTTYDKPKFAIVDSTNNNLAQKLHTNGPTEVSGIVGRAQSFDGTDDYVSTIDGILSSGSDLTLECYIKPDNDFSSGGAVRAILTDQGRVLIEYNQVDGALGFRIWDTGSNTATYTGTLSADNWYYIAGTFDGANVKLYLDGDLKNTVAGDWISLTYPFTIGIARDLSNTPTDAIIDEVRVSSAPRPAYWIKANYYALNDDFISFDSVELPFSGYFAGTVEEGSVAISGSTIYMYRRDNGNYLGSTISSGNGGFYIETTYSGSHLLVCLDKEDGIIYNDLIYGDMYPITISG